MAQTSPAQPAPSTAVATLSPAEVVQRLRATKVIAGSLPLQGWIDALTELGAGDKRGDRVRGWLGGLAVGAGIVALIMYLVELFIPAIAASAVLAGLIVAYVVKARQDLANHLREFVVPLLRVLRQDAGPEAPVELSLRLTDRFDSKNRTQKLGGVEHFSYPWLAGRTRLLDGATLDFQISDEARRWSVSKRSRSGKTKTKTKIAMRTDVSVRLGAPLDGYAPQAPRSPAEVQVKTTAKRHVVTATRSIKRKGASGLDLGLRDFLGVVALCYGSLAPTGRGKDKKGGA